MTTALDGPAFLTRLPMSFSSARTRPNVSPTTMMSPTLSVPVCTSAVAIGPRFLSSCASTIVPIALRFGLALSSCRSATSRIISMSSSSPTRVLAETAHERHVAAVLLDDDAGLGQLGLDAVGVGVRLVDLVQRDDDRDLGRLRVADRLERLGHDAVVRRHDDHGDVGDLGAAGTHGGERLVTRRVEEDDALAVVGDLARADVLGDAAALAGRHFGRPDRVEQARLAVVDVAHDGHDRGARLEQRRDRPPRRGLPWSPRRPGLRPRLRPPPGPAAIVSATSKPSSPATSDAVSRSMSWLMVAKMPLLISSRMTSAGLTDSSSASSLTVMVPGSSIAPRSRGSATWTCPFANAPSRRGGLRGPRRPRVPLLLLATGSSFDGHVSGRRLASERIARRGGQGCLEGPAEGALVERAWSRQSPRPADVGAATGEPAGRRRRRPNRPGVRTIRWRSRFGRTVRHATHDPVRDRVARRARAPRLRRHLLGGRLVGVAAFLVARLRLGRRVASRSARPSVGGRGRLGVAAASAAAFLVTRFGLAGGGFGVVGARLRRRPARSRPRPRQLRPRPSSSRASAWRRARPRPGVSAAGASSRSSRPRRPRSAAARPARSSPPRRRRLGLGHGHVAPDVDPPAGQPGRQPGVLALAADGQREHPLGHGHVRDPVLLVDVDAR